MMLASISREILSYWKNVCVNHVTEGFALTHPRPCMYVYVMLDCLQFDSSIKSVLFADLYATG